jgi:hypothetical protein
VLAALAARGVRCCLWRGTARIDRAFAGASDFDLLVHVDDGDALAAVMMAAGYRRAHTRRPDVGLEDWFGLADAQGPLLHFHVHHRLVAGEPRLNRFHLPFEQQVLDTRVCGPRGTFVADPVVESALVLLRCALELRVRDRLPCAPAGPRLVQKVNGDLLALAAGRTPAVRELLRRWLDRDVSIADPPLGLGDLFRLRRHAAAALRPHAAVTGPRAAASLWARDLRAVLRKGLRRLGSSLLVDRSPESGGIGVALAGGDAASRAELADALAGVFAGKFDVLRVASCATPRAQRAVRRGLLVIGDRADDGGADAVFALEPGKARSERLAALLAAVFGRF